MGLDFSDSRYEVWEFTPYNNFIVKTYPMEVS